MRIIHSPAKLTRCLTVAVVVLLASYAMAGTMHLLHRVRLTGAPITGPCPNSTAAQAAFLAAAGLTTTADFESLPVGDYTHSPVAWSDCELERAEFGNGFSGISDVTNGNLYGSCVANGRLPSGLTQVAGTAAD